MIPRKPVRTDPRLPWLGRLRWLLAPMSGVTDRAFRDVCRGFGMDMGFCEFTSASGLYHASETAWRLIDTEDEPGLVGIQIFGSDPDHMAAAARLLAGRHMDVLDINFGCPAKKVVKKCGGSALLADLPLLERVTRAVLAASPVPVTAKIRSGWDHNSVNYREVGLMLQELGCAWVTLHGRTRAQKFAGKACWEHIAQLVEALEIPVIGNGDVTDGQSAAALLAQTRCHAVMVARGAIGNPWIFQQMAGADQGQEADPPRFDQMCAVVAGHVKGERARRGERAGLLVTRKHIARCFRGHPGAAALRKRLFACATTEQMITTLEKMAESGLPAPAAAVASPPGSPLHPEVR